LTISEATRDEVDAILRSQSSYASLVWALRFTVVAVALCVITIISGVDTLILIALVCPMISLLLLLAIMVFVVASQARPQLPDDSLRAQLQLPLNIAGLAGRDAITGLPRPSAP
jgi:hypothetical protein